MVRIVTSANSEQKRNGPGKDRSRSRHDFLEPDIPNHWDFYRGFPVWAYGHDS